MRTRNPYRPQPGGDPPLLVGRQAELETVATTLRSAREGGPMRPAVFVGLRGMGKTALLRRGAALAREDGAVVVSVEASEAEPLSRALAAGLERATREASLAVRLRDALGGLLKVLPSASYELPGHMGAIELDARGSNERVPFYRALTELNDAVRARDSYLVLALDEVQEATLHDLRELVMFIHETAGTNAPAVFLGAGLTNSAKHLHDARTYTERWRYPRLDLLAPADTRDAIAIPAKRRDVTFTDEALDALVAETAGYPFFIQEYASVIWAQTDGPLIDRAGVDRLFPFIRAELDDQFYAPRFARLTARECAYVLVVATLGDGPIPVHEIAQRFGVPSSALSSIRNQLLKKEVLFASAPGFVEFRMPLTARYIERNREALERRARGASASYFIT